MLSKRKPLDKSILRGAGVVPVNGGTDESNNKFGSEGTEYG